MRASFKNSSVFLQLAQFTSHILFHFQVHSNLPDHQYMFDEHVQDLRWFLLPSEALSYLHDKPISIHHKCAISVRKKVRQLTKEEIVEKVRPQKFFDLYSPHKLPDMFANIGLQRRNLKQSEKLPPKDKAANNNGSFSSENPTNSPALTCSFGVKKRKEQQLEKDEKFQFVSPPKRLFKLTAEAIEEFSMIENGDKVLVCLSGGKVICH